MFLGLLSTCCLLGPLYVIYKPPVFLIEFFQRRWPTVLFHHTIDKNVVALTIDDAPSVYTANVETNETTLGVEGENTPKILDLLRENEATATFFVIGSQVPGFENSLKKLVHAGNELANHAMYDEPSRALSDVQLKEQMLVVQDMIQEAYRAAGKGTGPDGWFFRPGSGFFSSRMRRVVTELGYRLVLGDVYPHDPQVPYAGINAKHILSMVRPGSIIVCHDRREWTVPMLQVVLPELRRRGYRVVTVSELLRESNSE
ncbi:Polysaccharide deacetylase (NodB) [Penicillium angulare]|uniref:chitin deacetylase n=1 Tax=Penicillium angulare TaxID=116970 RepID=A0A9W9EVS0_9EURO|nr:Polysaccharide deacetylase (NodB) [Penicillium angulare]